MDVQHYVETLGVQPNTSQRHDCPVCGGRKTFSVTNNGTETLWNCFHASCDLRGRSGMRMTLDNAEEFIRMQQRALGAVEEEQQPFLKPTTWKKPNAAAQKFFDSVYTTGRYEDLYYDLRRNRAVYGLRDANGTLVDGVGRTLEGARPKWYRYGNYHGGFICGTGSTVVVVEDVPSAVAISDWVTGYALMGTSLRDQQLDELRKYDRVILALDMDATDKSVKIAREVGAAGVLFLDEDLKAMGEEDRESTIRSILA